MKFIISFAIPDLPYHVSFEIVVACLINGNGNGYQVKQSMRQRDFRKTETEIARAIESAKRLTKNIEEIVQNTISEEEQRVLDEQYKLVEEEEYKLLDEEANLEQQEQQEQEQEQIESEKINIDEQAKELEIETKKDKQ